MEINIKKKKNITRISMLLVFGFLSLNLFIFFASFEDLIESPHILKYFFSIITIYLFIRFFRISPRVKFETAKIYLIHYVFLFVSVFLLLRSIRFEVFFIQELFAERFFFLPYLIPLLFIFVRYDLHVFKKLLRISYILMPFAIFVEILIVLFFLDTSNYVYIVTS